MVRKCFKLDIRSLESIGLETGWGWNSFQDI